MPLTSVRQLELLPSEDLLDLVRSSPEDQWLDRISARSDARHLSQVMVGFANADGGLVVLGIHDKAIEGVDRSPRRVNEWRQAALDFTEPPVRHTFTLFPCTNSDGHPDHIAIVDVESSDRVHTDQKGETYLRVGDENRRLTPTQAQELRFDKGDSVYDGTAVKGASYSDLNSTLVDRYLSRIKATSGDALRARGLLSGDDSAAPTAAGILVLAKEPQRFFPQAFVRVLVYRGASRETGNRSNVFRDRRIEGSLPNQIDGTRRLLRRWLPSAIRLQARGVFARSPIFPEFAWLEGIVNAVVHRSYSLAGDHTRVEIFEDRVEVNSPGRLPGLVRVDTIRSTRFARNPRIARALNDLGYGRELGEGVNRMFEEMARAGLPDPLYVQGPASVVVTLHADTLARRLVESLPVRSERFVEHILQHGSVTTTEAVNLLGVSRPTALMSLRRLQAEELLEHVGTSQKDPRGFWRLSRPQAT